MSWILSLLVGVLTAVAGLLAAGFVADLCVRWYSISSFEGGAGYFVVGIALLGGIAGFVLGLVVARWVAHRPDPTFLGALGRALALVAVITLVGGGLARLGGDVAPELDGEELALLVELRMPAGWTPPADFAERKGQAWLAALGLGNARRRTDLGHIGWDGVAARDGRWVIPSRSYVFTTRGRRLLRVIAGDSVDVEFLVPLPARPDRAFLEWSDWTGDGFATEVGKPPVTGYEFRFRVEPWGAERERQEAADSVAEAAVRAAFARLGPSSPLEAWLEYTPASQPGDRRGGALAALRARLDEYPALFRSRDPVQLQRALEAAFDLPDLPDGAKGAVLEAGRTLADSLEAWRPGESGVAETLQAGLGQWMTLWHRRWPDDMATARPVIERVAQAAAAKGEESPFTQLASDAGAALHDCCGQPDAPRE
ncbi:MAG TPA: hypothetical protein VFX50_06745 [Gemmatimonadales bacterium]|nr:hypothetical protein [Gemmatimonadales bacterium]